MNKILFIANNNLGNGLSGGDRIFLELVRIWQKNINLTIFGSLETKNLLDRYQINCNFILSDNQSYSFCFHHILRTIKACVYIIKNSKQFLTYNYVYSVSDFLPDSFPAFLIKLINPKIKWIAGFFLFAPNPFSKNNPYRLSHQYLKGFFYYLEQIPCYFLIKYFADIVYVTSKPDTLKFKQKTIIIRGGVPDNYIHYRKHKKIYQAIFIGRFHPQKGVLLLIDIWKKVIKKIPSAKLVIIGEGDLREKIISKIKVSNLTRNILMYGFLDGNQKLKLISQSQIVVHPATYDSGGMAAAEAMSLGLPGVSFNLESLKTYYPQGFLKTQCFSKLKFANNIVKLLNNPHLYQKKSIEAITLIKNHWLWSKQAKNIYEATFSQG